MPLDYALTRAQPVSALFNKAENYRYIAKGGRSSSRCGRIIDKKRNKRRKKSLRMAGNSLPTT